VAAVDDDGYRPGRVRGPARLILRYRAGVRLHGARGKTRAQRASSARRIEIEPLAGPRGRAPLANGRVIRPRKGQEVLFK
jgi:hypothetical protein